MASKGSTQRKLTKAIANGDMDAIKRHGEELGMSTSHIKGMQQNSVGLQRRFGTVTQRVGRAVRTGVIAAPLMIGAGAFGAHQGPAFTQHMETTRVELAEHSHDREVAHQEGRLSYLTDSMNRELADISFFNRAEKKRVTAKWQGQIAAERKVLNRIKANRNAHVRSYPQDVKSRVSWLKRGTTTYSPHISMTGMWRGGTSNVKYGAMAGLGLTGLVGVRSFTRKRRKAKREVKRARKAARAARKKHRK